MDELSIEFNILTDIIKNKYSFVYYYENNNVDFPGLVGRLYGDKIHLLEDILNKCYVIEFKNVTVEDNINYIKRYILVSQEINMFKVINN